MCFSLFFQIISENTFVIGNYYYLFPSLKSTRNILNTRETVHYDRFAWLWLDVLTLWVTFILGGSCLQDRRIYHRKPSVVLKPFMYNVHWKICSWLLLIYGENTVHIYEQNVWLIVIFNKSHNIYLPHCLMLTTCKKVFSCVASSETN